MGFLKGKIGPYSKFPVPCYSNKTLCGDAILIASYLINRMPSKILDYKTLIEKISTLFPNFHRIGKLPPKFLDVYLMYISRATWAGNLILEPFTAFLWGIPSQQRDKSVIIKSSTNLEAVCYKGCNLCGKSTIQWEHLSWKGEK